MLKKLLLKKQRIDSEDGFTLVEVMIGILIIGILTAIAVPIWVNSQNEINSQPIRADLQSAGILIGQEAVDNNGLFPKYLPNEMKNHPTMEGMIYSYSDSRTSWCVQAFSPAGKLFISSRAPGQITSVPCTENNIAEGGILPWQPPAITTPSTPTATNTWAGNLTSSTSTINISAVTCTLAAQDQAEWNSSRTIQYRVKVTNDSRAGEFYYTPWSTNRTVITQLEGWLPYENITYSAQARCLISNGLDYSYQSTWSGERAGTIAVFSVAPTPITLFAAAWTNASAFRVTIAWADTFCPAGTKQSLLSIKDNATGSVWAGSTTWASWRTSFNATTSAWSSGGTTTATHTAGCLLPNGTRITSPATSITGLTTIKPPAAPTGLITKTVTTPTTTVTPTNLQWNPVTCQAGSPQYQITRTSPGTGTSGWFLGTTYTLALTPETSYTYLVNARCVVGANASTASANSTPVTFVASYPPPSAPAVPGNTLLSVSTANTGTSGHTLKWAAVTCNNNATAHYQVRQTIKAGATLSTPTVYPWQTSTTYNILATSLQNGSKVGFTVTAKCANGAGEEVGATSSQITGILGIPKPKILEASSNGQSSVSWSGASCPVGTTLQYRSTQTKYGNTTGAWAIRAWGASTTGVTPKYFQGHQLEATVEPRCVGTDYTVEGDSRTVSWISPISSQPNAIAVSGGGYAEYTLSWSGGGGCPTATTSSNWILTGDSTPSRTGWTDVHRSFSVSTTNTTRPVFPDGTTYWFQVQQRCYTTWATGPYTYSIKAVRNV